MAPHGRVALLHAYRVANRGDGWLVELAAEVVSAAGARHPVTYALDPSGMPGEAHRVLPPPTAVRAGAAAATSALRSTSWLARRVAQLPSPAQLSAAVGVGGAYLRANDRRHQLVLRAHHLPQVDLMAELGDRAIYLPISIGPLPGGLERTVRDRLARVGTICVRDDTSAELLTGHPGVHRLPDLAVCAIGRGRPDLAERVDASVAFALRELPGSEVGANTARMLARRGHDVMFGIQSTEGFTNDDTRYYAKLGVLPAAVPFGDLLAGRRRPAVVVAGRLHAALAAIRAGIPTIHLGYERKSWGAFHDLGLSEWLVHAWEAEEEQLAERVEQLLEDPRPYWTSLSGRFDDLDAAWDELRRLTLRALGGD